MATGDDAVSGGMSLVDGASVQAKDIDTQINATRDYIANGHTRWKGGLAPVPVSKGGTGATSAGAAKTALGTQPVNLGGTGATTASAARTNLDVPATAHTHSSIDNGGNHFAYEGSSVWGTDGGLRVAGRADFTNHIYVPNSTAAVSSFTVAYINGDGRISRGASSERYKKFISDVDPLTLDIFPQLVRFQMKGGDGSWMLGYIAERLDENESTQPFVVRVDGEVESIDFIQLLLAQVANLNARLVALES